jgi:hypothetical protein
VKPVIAIEFGDAMIWMFEEDAIQSVGGTASEKTQFTTVNLVVMVDFSIGLEPEKTHPSIHSFLVSV